MLYRLSIAWSEKLAVRSGRDAEIMAYGLEVLLSSVINLFLLCIVSLLLSIFDKMLMYVTAFALMRAVAAGGYHAKNHILCFIQYTAVSLTAIYLSILCAPNLYLAIAVTVGLSCFSIFSVFKYAPVESKNRPISESENEVFKKRSRVVVMVLCMISAAFLTSRQNAYALICSLAVFVECVSLLPILNKGVVEK